MATELKTFRFDIDVLQRIRDICKRRGDLSYHINEALREYIDKTAKPEPVKPVVNKQIVNDNGDVDAIIDYLNDCAQTKYRHTDTNRKLINARLKDYSTSEVCDVIDKKCGEWKGTEMARYLRPSTLFNATKFEEYLNQKIIEGNKNGTNQFQPKRKESAIEGLYREQAAMDAKREASRNNGTVMDSDGSIISTQVYSSTGGAH